MSQYNGLPENIWRILQIEPTTSKREIRRAYAAQAQNCHPEEQPEAFAKLQEAYQLALKYTEQSDVVSRAEKLPADLVIVQKEEETKEDGVEETSNDLLAAFESGYEAEQKRRQGEGILKELIAVFEEPKTAKGNKAWAEFFLSDLFLQNYFSEDFAESLDFYLEHQTIYEREELPQGFLVEWAIAYAMITDVDGCMYQAGDIPMRKVIAKYWNQQTQMWRLQRGARMLLRVENKVKLQAFSDYITLRMMEKQGTLTLENEYGWRDMLWHGQPHFLYEVCKRTEKNATSIILLKLFAYWILKEEAPLFLAEKMYQEYNLKGNEKSGYYSVYKELKEAILQRFPDIEKDDVQEAIKEWTGRLMELSAAFATKAEIEFEPETEAETAQMEKLFSEEVWKQYRNHPFMAQWLVWKLKFHNMPLTIAQHLHDAYSLSEEMASSDGYNRRELCEHSMMAIVNYRKHTDKNRAIFWEYFFQRGFGVCGMEDDRLYLPDYMKRMYRIVSERQKEFLGYHGDTGRIDKLQCYEFTLPDGEVIKVEYYLHFVAYYRNGQRIYKPYLSYDVLQNYEKEIMVPEEFFFLLALTVITEADREAARELILKWLPKTMLLENTFSVIADCIVQNNALDRRTEACAISETENMCLMVQHTEQGFELYEYSERGWIARNLRAGIDWQKQDPESVLRSHMKPVTKRIHVVEMKGLSAEEKCKAVWDSLLLYAKHEKGAGLSEPIVPEEYPMLHTLFNEGGMGWLTDSFVVLYREIVPGNISREVLYTTVGRWGCYPAYLKSGNMGSENYNLQKLQDRIRRTRPENLVLGGSIIREDYPGHQFSQSEPILFGESGKVYGRYGMAKLCETDSALELLSKMVDLENVVRCEVYEGKVTVSAQSGQLEYCFTKEAYREACVAYEKDWAYAYTVVEAQAEAEGMFEQEDENEESEWYKKETLNRMTEYYLMEMDKEERYQNRVETLVEYYCVMN